MRQRLILFVPLVVFAALIGLFVANLGKNPEDMPSALLDKPVPTFVLPRLENPQENFTEKSLKGQITLLNVWATWCVTCREEHAFLNQLSQQGFHIIGVDYKDDTESALRWIQQLGNPYADIIVDTEGRLGLDLGVFGAPETYLIDQKGIIRYKIIGDLNQKRWDEEVLPVIKHLQAAN